MKKEFFLFLFGTAVMACSTQEKVISTPTTQENHQLVIVDSLQTINETQHQQIYTNDLPLIDTLPRPIHEDTLLEIPKAEIKVIQTITNSQTFLYGHVDTRRLITNMQEYNHALQRMDSLQKYLANQYEMMVQEFQKKEVEYRTDTTVLPMVLQIREQELQSMAERIRYFQETSQQQISMEENRLISPIYEKMREAVKQVAEELHLLGVFEDSYLLYSSTDAIDVTDKVIQKLK